MKSFHMYTIAATGGRFRPTPITVLLERGEGFFRVVPTLWKTADQKKKDRRKQYSGRHRQTQADSDSQPCRRRDPVSGQQYFPAQIDLVGSAKMLAMAYKLKRLTLQTHPLQLT